MRHPSIIMIALGSASLVAACAPTANELAAKDIALQSLAGSRNPKDQRSYRKIVDELVLSRNIANPQSAVDNILIKEALRENHQGRGELATYILHSFSDQIIIGQPSAKLNYATALVAIGEAAAACDMLASISIRDTAYGAAALKKRQAIPACKTTPSFTDG